MISLSRFFHANTSDSANPPLSSPRLRAVDSGTIVTEMSGQGGNPPNALGVPGSLKTVFGTSDPHVSVTSYENIDGVLPEYPLGSMLSSNATSGRRSRLDDSAGEGLRRNVLVRNAMLSSLERERNHLSQEVSASDLFFSGTIERQGSSVVAVEEEEAQFFEDLLSELSGANDFLDTNTKLETMGPGDAARDSTQVNWEVSNDEEDFVELEPELPSRPVLVQAVASSLVALATGLPREGVAAAVKLRAETEPDSAPSLAHSCLSTCSAQAESADSGFAEAASRPNSVASCCAGYPNVRPYPATGSSVGASSEELPALIDDNDSDLDEDDDEDGDQFGAESKSEHPSVPVADACAVMRADGVGVLSRPMSPVVSPAHSTHADFNTFRDSLSPESSRPTSPMSSASSKGDGDATSPLLLPSDLSPLLSLSELSLHFPVSPGPDLLVKPSRALAGAWFENKLDTPAPASRSGDRMRWTTSPATYLRSASIASTSTLSDHQPSRSGADGSRGSYPLIRKDDAIEHSVVVHWSR